MGDAWNIRSHSASPHSTPTAKATNTRASLRPPVFNPYDRFTQPEFDAWIGDITNALKRALDHESEPTVKSPSRHGGIWNTIPDHLGGTPSAAGRARSPTLSEVHDEESAVEDSFAQIASRRAKGKARDPREGPGLGLKGQPIELLSDSEEEEVIESLEAHAAASDDSDSIILESSSDETDYVESEVDDNAEANVGKPGTSAQHTVTLLSSEVSVHDQESASPFDAKARRTGGEDSPFSRNTEAPLGENCDRNESFAVMGSMRGNHDEFPVSSQSAAHFDVELTDPWDGPRTFAEDYYSGGDRLVPGLTPNHLTPLSRSPAPILPLPTISNADPDEDRLPLTPSVLSTSPSPKPQDTMDTMDSSVIRGVLQHRTTVDTPIDQDDVGEPAAGSYYDRIGVNDIAVYIVEDTERDAAEGADGLSIIKASPIGKEIPTSYTARPNVRTNGRAPDRGHEIIWALPSDDEHTDADVEGDEEKFSSVLPLGTSDLDIRDDWYTTSGRKDGDYTSEEDELEEMEFTQTADDVTKSTALELSQSPETVVPSGLNAPLVEPRSPILASTFQLSDADSFGDLPVSSPPSETPSPAPDQPTEPFALRRRSIERLFADLEREASEKCSQVSEPPALLTGQPEAGTANSWASRELEHILSGEISDPVNVAGDSGSAPAKLSTSQEGTFPTQLPEYIVEEDKLGTEFVLPDDDLDDTRSIPPPDLAEVIDMVQLYEVEEPRTDGRLTEEPEITITSPPHPIISLIESTATPITAEDHVCPVPAIEVPDVPAPIVADPSVPDPVPGDSSRSSPLIRDSSNAPGLSIIPPAVLRVMVHDSAQISSGTSGLFTPAQISEGGTPRQSDDDAAESPTTPHDAADKGLEFASIPLQAGHGSSPIGSLITTDEGDGNAKDKDAMGEDELIEPLQPVSSNEHQIRIGVVDAGAQDTGVDTVESTVEGSPSSDHGSTKPTVSHSLEDSSFKKVVSKHSDIPDLSSEYVPGTPSIAEGDKDADGEADPDYSPTHGTKKLHQEPGHQPVSEGREIASSKIRVDVLGPNVIASDLEGLITSASARKQETEPVGETSSQNIQGDLSAERRDVRDKGDLAPLVQSDVKATYGREHPTRAPKRKRRDQAGSARITRSKSGVGVPRGKKKGPVLSPHRTTTTSEKAQSDWVGTNIDADIVDDGASEAASVSSGASAVYRLLHATSRAGSVDSSGSGDASWSSPVTTGPGRVIPLLHSHGLHHHGWSVHPPLNPPTLSSGHHKDTRPEQAMAKSPAPAPEPLTPSLKRSPSSNSPVTRSNCRFHKISLPSGEDGVRAYFVVPGCSLGDGELMTDNDIRDEGFSTHEDHKRMLPDVEILDLSSYLIGVLRQLVGVDLLREQQEIFYLPGEEEKPKKRRKTGALEGLRRFRRQSISSGGPLARDLSPRPSEISHDRGSPLRSVSGSARSPSLQEESENEDSALSGPDSDDDHGEVPPAKRHRSSAGEMMPPLENTEESKEQDSSLVPEPSALSAKEPTSSNRPSATRRSKRRNANHDTAAYKPSEDDIKDDEEAEEIKTRRGSTRRAPKRSRTMEESSTNPPRSKKSRLGRSISMADAGADS